MDRAWLFIWAFVGLLALIAVCTGATHHILTLGLAVAFYASEHCEIKNAEKAKEE